MTRFLLATLASGAWINLSEFLRNELFFKHFWLEKYASLGLAFPSTPANNAAWAAWGFLLAGCIAALRRRTSFAATFVLSWIFAFPLMWIVIGNLNVLPFGLLSVAAPWSLLEIALAVVIAQKFLGGPR